MGAEPWSKISSETSRFHDRGETCKFAGFRIIFFPDMEILMMVEFGIKNDLYILILWSTELMVQYLLTIM